MPFIAAAAWFTCDTTLLDLLALGAGTLFPRHMVRAFRFARIAPSALATWLRPLDAVCLCRLLAVFLVHAGITIIVQTQFIPGPLFLGCILRAMFSQFFWGVADLTPWFNTVACLHSLILPVTEGVMTFPEPL